MNFWTVMVKAPGDGRGEYSEEVDVYATTAGQARKQAQIVLAHGYVEGCRASRAFYRGQAPLGARAGVAGV